MIWWQIQLQRWQIELLQRFHPCIPSRQTTSHEGIHRGSAAPLCGGWPKAASLRRLGRQGRNPAMVIEFATVVNQLDAVTLQFATTSRWSTYLNYYRYKKHKLTKLTNVVMEASSVLMQPTLFALLML